MSITYLMLFAALPLLNFNTQREAQNHLSLAVFPKTKPLGTSGFAPCSLSLVANIVGHSIIMARNKDNKKKSKTSPSKAQPKPTKKTPAKKSKKKDEEEEEEKEEVGVEDEHYKWWCPGKRMEVLSGMVLSHCKCCMMCLYFVLLLTYCVRPRNERPT